MNACVFCKIIRKELPARTVYEDEHALAFLDINPVKPGHVLVVPKTHHPTMIETPDSVIADIFVTAKKIMAALKKAMAADFVTLAVVGTDVPHLHLHLTPRHKGDGLASWPTKNYRSEKEKEGIVKKIRSALA